MKEFAGILMLIALVAIVGMIALGQLNETFTEKNNSQAAVMNAQTGLIAAQSESRLNASQAALPYAVMGVGLTVTGVVVLVALMVVAKSAPAQPPAPLLPARIEKQIIWVIPAGMSHREFWQTLSKSTSIAQFEER